MAKSKNLIGDISRNSRRRFTYNYVNQASGILVLLTLFYFLVTASGYNITNIILLLTLVPVLICIMRKFYLEKSIFLFTTSVKKNDLALNKLFLTSDTHLHLRKKLTHSSVKGIKELINNISINNDLFGTKPRHVYVSSWIVRNSKALDLLKKHLPNNKIIITREKYCTPLIDRISLSGLNLQKIKIPFANTKYSTQIKISVDNEVM